MAFPTTAESRLECTLLVSSAPGREDGWYLVTDLPPQVADAAWYGLRMWIEHGFEQFKSGGWQWQKSRITGPGSSRPGVVGDGGGDAVGRLGKKGGGGRWPGRDDAGPVAVHGQRVSPAVHQDPGDVAPALGEPPHTPRLISVLRKGLAAVVAALVLGRGVILGRWYPEPWPQIPNATQGTSHEPDSYSIERNLPQ